MKEQKEFVDQHDIPLRQKKTIGNRSFDIEKALEIKVPKITINRIPDDVDLEKTPEFRLFLRTFNKIYGTEITLDDLLYSKSNFRAFSDFILYCAIKGHISIADDRLIGEFIQAFEKLQKKYAHNLRSMEKYYDEIIRTIYYPQGLTKKDKQVIEDMYLFEQAYSLVKLAFKDKKRDSQERYFEHLKGTMEIVLRELPNPNINKIIIALLHDIQEDLPEYEDVIQRIYGDYIAKGVDILSKKERQEYLTEEEHDQYTTTHDQKLKRHISERAKERRNDDYFGHLNDLDDDILDVKFADRIHNLRDMNGVTKEKLHRKIEETKKYFIHVAEQRNPTAYTLMMNEIKILEQLLKTDKNR